MQEHSYSSSDNGSYVGCAGFVAAAAVAAGGSAVAVGVGAGDDTSGLAVDTLSSITIWPESGESGSSVLSFAFFFGASGVTADAGSDDDDVSSCGRFAPTVTAPFTVGAAGGGAVGVAEGGETGCCAEPDSPFFISSTILFFT